jgi:uncharacterized protein
MSPLRLILLVLALIIGGTWLVAEFLAARRGGSVTEEIRWGNGEVDLAGTLYLPEGDGPHPAALFIPGWGDWTRSEGLFRVHAERLARRGIAMVIFDKRGCGDSTGEWRRAGLADLAEDALGGVRLLRADPRIDGERIGLFGTSQGGAIGVIAASRSRDVTFLATLSLSTRSPAEHDNFIVGARLRQEGFPDEEIERAVELHRRILEVHRTGLGWEELREEAESARGEAWFEESGIEFPPRDSWRWEAYRDLPIDHDLMSLLVEFPIPLFAAQGEEDWLVPGPRAAGILSRLAREHHRDFTVVMIPAVGHALRERAGWLGRPGWRGSGAYWDALEEWLDEVVGEPG